MIGLGFVYAVAGCVFAGYAASSLASRRWRGGAFWGLLATSFLFGDRLGDIGNGLLVLALVTLAALGLQSGSGFGTSRRPDEGQGISRPDATPPDALTFVRATDGSGGAALHGNRLFVPALIVPLLTVAGTIAFKAMPTLVDAKQATLVALTCAIAIALGIACFWLRPRLAEPIDAGRRLMDQVSWAALLPQMLAALGAVFAVAGIGETVGGLVGRFIPTGDLAVAVLAYGGGMALLTMLMGNAFAAFPVMTAAIGLPMLIHGQHGNPAAVAALGMLCGFSGTLLTPMAANFNLVPAALLGLKDRYGVIRAQAPSAALIGVANLLILYFLAFPR